MTSEGRIELNKLLTATLIPVFFLVLCWLMFASEILFDVSLSQYGLKPREISQWFGIFTMPFFHADLSHIFANSVSFIVLGTMIFYFYPEKALSVFLLSYFMTGVFTWLIGFHGVHIGASGMVYAFAAYLFTVGARSRNIPNMALSLVVVFLYGSMVWGLYPQNTGISWEGHLSGAISGVILAFIFPVKHVELPPLDDDDEFDTTLTDTDVSIKYFYKDFDGRDSK